MNFNREKFAEHFQQALDAIAGAENVTKRELRELSRTVLEATHETGDIQFCNKLLQVLSPVNRKVAVVYLKHFTGFSYDDKQTFFTKKSKKRYDAAHAAYVEAMSDPMFNIWTWAEKHVEVEPKKFDLHKVTDYMRNAVLKAQAENILPVDVLKAALKATTKPDAAGNAKLLFSVQDVVALLGELGVEVDNKMEEPGLF